MKSLLSTLVACLLIVSCHAIRPDEPEPFGVWVHPTMRVVLPNDAPWCAWIAVEEAWKVLAPAVGLEVVNGLEDARPGPIPGSVTVVFEHPPIPSAIGLSRMYFSEDGITSGVLWAGQCDVRLFAHELGHQLGLKDKDAPGELMHWAYPAGGWVLSGVEKEHLRIRYQP